MECTIKDVNVYYEVHGEGTPVLMIHGWRPDHRLMKGCMEPIFRILDRAAHSLQIEQDVMFTTAVKEWLDRVSAEL